MQTRLTFELKVKLTEYKESTMNGAELIRLWQKSRQQVIFIAIFGAPFLALVA
jgi:hypothetical protein